MSPLHHLQCNGAGKTMIEKTALEVIKGHNHLKNFNAVQAAKCYDDIKRRTVDAFAKPSQVFAEGVKLMQCISKSRITTRSYR